MGDVGYIDDRGRLWFCGRKSHRVVTPHGTLFTDMVEPIFNTVPGVFRTALVGVTRGGVTLPLLCVERREDLRFYGVPVSIRPSWNELVAQLCEAGARHEHTRGVVTFVEHVGPFPVDVRHNSKIFREKLAVWADRKLGKNWKPGASP
jgi:acyl-CoA synthetase (AMP-forming)/AMP-acid ligase II